MTWSGRMKAYSTKRLKKRLKLFGYSVTILCVICLAAFQITTATQVPRLKQVNHLSIGTLLEEDEQKNHLETPGRQEILDSRKKHVSEVCRKYGLDQETASNQINAWEFFVNKKYNLAWCPVFKAASSTWIFNFNILAGYKEQQLLTSIETPVTLARKKYPRPTVDELKSILNTKPKPLTFVISRHPFDRLVSGYRNKLEKFVSYYGSLSRKIVQNYSYMRDEGAGHKKRPTLSDRTPSFAQFVQFVIDSVEQGDPLDEHWAPAVEFCSVCLIQYDVLAKVESLVEDGSYILEKSGIDDLIIPRKINEAKDKSTNEVARSYICQLSDQQVQDLIQLYRYDFEVFDYEYESFLSC